MSKSQWLTLGVTVAYLGIAMFHFRENRRGLGTAFLGYTVANTGLIWAESQTVATEV